MIATDWVAVSSIVTAAATLVLAIATFLSVRSANRAARAAERSLLAGLRPLLAPSRLDDPPVKVGFQDDRWFSVPGSGAIVEATDDVVYLAIALRNVGSGIAVLHGWYFHPDRSGDPPPPVDEFERLTRDLYVAPGEIGFWQGTYRDPSSERFLRAHETVERGAPFSIDVLYGDHELGQRSITRFLLTPRDDRWLVSVGRHRNVDRPNPR